MNARKTQESVAQARLRRTLLQRRAQRRPLKSYIGQVFLKPYGGVDPARRTAARDDNGAALEGVG